MASILKSDILMVGLKTSLDGGVNYERVDTEPEHTNGGGEAIAKWETTRKIADPIEHAEAVKVRGKARALVSALCASTDFGLLCTVSQREQLLAAAAEAKALCEVFNATSKHSKVHVYVSEWCPAGSLGDTARGIAGEIAELMANMETGLAQADPEAIRKAANRAKQIGAILDDKQAAKVTLAIESARKAAREIVKRVEKEGEDATKVLADLGAQRAAVEMARFAFLDLEAEAAEPVQVEPEPLPAVNVRDLEV